MGRGEGVGVGRSGKYDGLIWELGCGRGWGVGRRGKYNAFSNVRAVIKNPLGANFRVKSEPKKVTI